VQRGFSKSTIVDIHVDSGLSSLKFDTETRSPCGFLLNHVWPVDPNYESFEVSPRIWYKACSDVANEEANNDEEAMVIFRSLFCLLDYHISHYHATMRGYDKIFKYFIIYVDKGHRSKGNFFYQVCTNYPIAEGFYIHARVSNFVDSYFYFDTFINQATFPNPEAIIEKINCELKNGAQVVIDSPFFPYTEIDFVRGSRRVINVQDPKMGQLWMSVLPPKKS
jgi:hypothetical protein